MLHKDMSDVFLEIANEMEQLKPNEDQ